MNGCTRLDTFRLMASRGVQLPSMIGLGYLDGRPTNFGIPLRISGNPDLDPMAVMNYEVGYDHRFPQLDTLARFSLYRQTSKNLIGEPDGSGARINNVSPAGIDLFFSNVGSSDATGLELGLDGKIGASWRWGLNYAYEIVDDDLVAAFNDGQPSNVAFEETTPRHKINGRIGYTRGAFEADLTAHYVSSTRMPVIVPGLSGYQNVDIDDYLIFNGRIGYHLNDIITVAVEGLSFNQTTHRETSLPEVERRLYMSVRADF